MNKAQSVPYVPPNYKEHAAYIAQAVEDLRYYVAFSKIDPRQYHIWRQEEVTQGALVVRATIIGESHVLNVTHGRTNISEVLACTDSCVADNIVINTRVPGYKKSFRAKTKDVSYHSNITIGSYSNFASRINNIAEEIASGNHVIGMNQAFPSGIKGHPDPRTKILVQRTPTGLVISTVHEYDEQLRAAVTRSTITFSTESIC